MVYAPEVFTLQARTTNAIREDGNVSQATIFSAFAAQDHGTNSSVVSSMICNKLMTSIDQTGC